jgi:hypothetical protein
MKWLPASVLKPKTNRCGSQVELAAAHKKVTAGIGTYEATFLIDQMGAADGTIFPPVFPVIVFARRRFALVHIVISEKFTCVLG